MQPWALFEIPYRFLLRYGHVRINREIIYKFFNFLGNVAKPWFIIPILNRIRDILACPKTGRNHRKVYINCITGNIVTDFLPEIPCFFITRLVRPSIKETCGIIR